MDAKKWTMYALLALGTCGCMSNRDKDEPTSTERWLVPSPVLAQQIADEAERMPWTHGVERLELIHWFASLGEPGYKTLLELAADPREHVSSAALAALGATRDSRLVESIRAIPYTREQLAGDLGFEHARALLYLGDWSGIPVLVRGLMDERFFTRSLCDKSLRTATGEGFGYDPRGTEEGRRLAAERWEQWWLARTGEGILQP